MIQPKVAIIILNWNGKEDTIECLESLKYITYPNYEILLVDNGSTDGSVKCFREMYSEIEIIENGGNLGFARGVNVGIKHYLVDKNTSFILLLNNDTIVYPDFLDKLIESMNINKNIGIASSKLINQNNQIQFQYNYLKPKVVYLIKQFIFFNLSKNLYMTTADLPIYIDVANGASMLINAKVIEKIGYMDSCFSPVYGEESDFCCRAKKAGFKIVFAPKSIVIHKEAAASEKLNNNYLYCIKKRNALFFSLLNMPLTYLILDIPVEIGEFISSFPRKQTKYWLKAYYISIINIRSLLYKRRRRTDYLAFK